MELVHADLCGPMQTKTAGGNLYFFLLTHDYTRYSWVYFLQSKDQMLECFKSFKILVEKQYGHSLKVLRTDRDGEFTSKDFRIFCEAQGIQRQLTTFHTPEQNGVTERKNRTVVEMARCMMKEMNVPVDLWAETVATAVHILNMSPTQALQNCTPYQAPQV